MTERSSNEQGRIAVFARPLRGRIVPVDPDKQYTPAYLRQFADTRGEVHVTTMPDRSKG